MRPRGRVGRASDWQRWFDCVVVVVLILVRQDDLHLVLGVLVRWAGHVPMAERGWRCGNRLLVDLLVVKVFLCVTVAERAVALFARLSGLLGAASGRDQELG